MRLKVRPEDFSVRESWRFDEVPGGGYLVYAMDKQKVTTFQAIDRIAAKLGIPRSSLSFCGLKDKQGRTEQLIAIRGEEVSFQEPDLRLRLVGETDHPLSAKNTTSNRFGVTVRDLDPAEVERVPESLAEVNRLGVVNYFDSQRFGHLKHGQGFIAKDLLKGQWEHALHNLFAQPSELDATDDAKLKAFWKEHWGAWHSHGPKPDPRTFHILRILRERPTDFKAAFMTIEPRYRALILFTYQSYLWNEGVKLWLLELFARKSLVQIPYQVGALLFPREAPAELARLLREGTFPLLGPESAEHLPAGSGPAEAARRAIETSLRREKLTLPGLRIPDAPLFFKHEERPLTVVPGKLVAAPAEHDEFFPGKWRVRLSFTLPSGAYATLVVRRLFWFSEARERDEEQARLPALSPAPSPARVSAAVQPGKPGPATSDAPETPRERPKGFLERQRERKAKRQVAQSRTRETAATRKKPAPSSKKKPAKTAKRQGAPGPRVPESPQRD